MVVFLLYDEEKLSFCMCFLSTRRKGSGSSMNATLLQCYSYFYLLQTFLLSSDITFSTVALYQCNA